MSSGSSRPPGRFSWSKTIPAMSGWRGKPSATQIGHIHLHLASDGMEAMAYLQRQGVHLNAPRPDLILLDLNVPKMDGREVLARIKGDDSLKMIPTIVLSSSETDADVLISYQLQANCYLKKPAQWDAFDDLVRSIINFWLTGVKLPPRLPAG
jgi:chemotaxis family two-component system response regulator Rcp1